LFFALIRAITKAARSNIIPATEQCSDTEETSLVRTSYAARIRAARLARGFRRRNVRLFHAPRAALAADDYPAKPVRMVVPYPPAERRT